MDGLGTNGWAAPHNGRGERNQQKGKRKRGKKKQEDRCALLVIGKAKLDRKKQITMIIAINK